MAGSEDKQTPPPVVVGKANLRGALIPAKEDAPEDLSRVYTALVRKAEEALQWYESAQHLKRRGARLTRGTAIFLGALAAIAPSVIAALPDHLGTFAVLRLNPLATVIGVLAATMILVDKFYGFSSSWMRCAATYQEIQANLETFKIDWRRQLFLLKNGGAPTAEQILGVFDFLSAFLKSVNDSVRSETQSWVSEFKGALAELDQTVEAQRARAAAAATPGAKGAMRVIVAGLDTLEGRDWSLQVDNRKEEAKSGQSTAVVNALEPGLYKLRISARREGRPVAVEHSVLVKEGEISEVKVDALG